MPITKNFDVQFKIVSFEVITDGSNAGNVNGTWSASIRGNEISRGVFGFGAGEVMPIVSQKTDGRVLLPCVTGVAIAPEQYPISLSISISCPTRCRMRS